MVLRLRRFCKVGPRVAPTAGIVIPHSLIPIFFERIKTAIRYSEQQQQQRQQQRQQQQQQQPTAENADGIQDTVIVSVPPTLRRSPRHRRQPTMLA